MASPSIPSAETRKHKRRTFTDIPAAIMSAQWRASRYGMAFLLIQHGHLIEVVPEEVFGLRAMYRATPKRTGASNGPSLPDYRTANLAEESENCFHEHAPSPPG